MLDLPPEIQTEIFTFAYRDNSNDNSLLLPVEVILSHVCSKWRKLVIDSPTFWTAFKFDSHRRASAPIDKLGEYLIRSKKTHLLEFYLNMFYANREEAERRFKLIEIVLAHAGRWRSFTLYTDLEDSPTGLLGGLKDLNAPNLEYLALCFTSTSLVGIRDSQNSRPSVLARGAPKVSAVRIDASSHLLSLPPLSNIATLTIQDFPETVNLHCSFHTFRCILMIPTLTNLSIECFISLLDGASLNNSEALSRIVMPSLRTLRISQDHGILALSLLDAPLLRTLVLHCVDLAAVYLGQGIRKMTSFKRLDTFALFNCRLSRNKANSVHPDHLDPVDRILHRLTRYATHIVISHPRARSFIERGSNLLNFSKCKWPRLQAITLDLSTFEGLEYCLKTFEPLPGSVTVRVVKPILHARLEKACMALETIEVGDPLMEEYWPASGGIFQEVGNLRDIRWGEMIRARGPPRRLE